MSVIIKNIRKPENCKDCYKFGRHISSETIECSVDTGWAYESNHYIRRDCPLVELPEKHGRLIDADALINYIKNWDIGRCIGHDQKTFIETINKTETILESEE